MRQTVNGGLRELRSAMDGTLIVPGDLGFDEGRRVWNAGIDRRPSAIARCTSAADVVAAIDFARERRLEVSVRGGAHNAAGTAVCEGGLMVDLREMNGVVVDPAGRRARVGGVPCWPIWTWRPRRRASPCLPGWSATPASGA